MREIGDMGARAADNFGAVFDQTVQFGGEWRDLRREMAFEALRLAFANTRKRAAYAIERLQTDAHLDEDRRDKTDAENGQRPKQDTVEFRDFVLHLRHIGGDEQRKCAGGAFQRGSGYGKFDPPRYKAQALGIGPFA